MQVAFPVALRAALLGVVLVSVYACGDGTGPEDPPVPGSLLSKVTMPPTGTVGAPVSIAPTVELRDRKGRPMVGAQVTFEVSAGGGSVTQANTQTNATGTASAGVWILGTTAGLNTVTARVNGVSPVTFQVMAVAGAASQLQVVAGDGQSAPVGTAVNVRPAVRVTDAHGNAVPGQVVTFAVSSGGGSVSGATITSGPDGVATAGAWTLGTVPGMNTLTATSTGLPQVAFTATAVVGPAARLVKISGDGQTVLAGGTVAIPPSVRVTDAFGNAVSGINVVFSPGSSGGSITGESSTTSANGVATVGSWTVGSTAGVYTLTAAAAGVGNVTFNAFAVTSQPTSAFDIEIRYVAAVDPLYQQVFAQAVNRWREVIVGDLQPVLLTSSAGQCGGAPALDNEIIDDLIIYVDLKQIDGEGNVLGQAGPCFVRSSNSLPVLGWMQFDIADLARMHANQTLQDVILHEMGHVLGVGTVWSLKGLLQGAGGADPYFSGAGAMEHYTFAGGVIPTGNGVPVENTGKVGEGTRDAHWRESTLRNELMTGFISGPGNPLSAITIGSLADLGYQVNLQAADSYTVPAGISGYALREQAVELIEVPMPPPIPVR